MADIFIEEQEWVRNNFNIENIILTNNEHTIQVAIGADTMYHCYIDSEIYGSGFTFASALIDGVEAFKQHKSKQ